MDDTKSHMGNGAIAMVAPCKGGRREPPPIAKINQADPILASSPNPLSAIP